MSTDMPGLQIAHYPGQERALALRFAAASSFARETTIQMQVGITVWGAEPNSSATRYVDDVRITPAQ